MSRQYSIDELMKKPVVVKIYPTMDTGEYLEGFFEGPERRKIANMSAMNLVRYVLSEGNFEGEEEEDRKKQISSIVNGSQSTLILQVNGIRLGIDPEGTGSTVNMNDAPINNDAYITESRLGDTRILECLIRLTCALDYRQGNRSNIADYVARSERRLNK